MRTQTTEGYTPSDEYKHPNACSLYSDEHTIRDEHAELLDAISEEFGDDVDVGAAGCGSCFTTGEPLAAFYIAQMPKNSDEFYLKFDADTDERDDLPDREEFGKAICRLAADLGIEWDWNGDTDKSIHIGKSDTYDEEVAL